MQDSRDIQAANKAHQDSIDAEKQKMMRFRQAMAQNLEESRRLKHMKDEQDKYMNQMEDEKNKKFNYFSDHDHRNQQRLQHLADFNKFHNQMVEQYKSNVGQAQGQRLAQMMNIIERDEKQLRDKAMTDEQKEAQLRKY